MNAWIIMEDVLKSVTTSTGLILVPVILGILQQGYSVWVSDNRGHSVWVSDNRGAVMLGILQQGHSGSAFHRRRRGGTRFLFFTKSYQAWYLRHIK